MTNFLKVLAVLLAGFVSTSVSGAVIVMVAKFGHFPLSYRQAVALSLLASFNSVRNISFDGEDKSWPELMGAFGKSLLAMGVFTLSLLLYGWLFGKVF